VVALVASLSAEAASAPATAQPIQVHQEVLGRVLEVIDATTVRVNRGRAEGLKPGADDLSLYPVRPDAEGTRSFGGPERLARARVESLEEHSALVKLSAVTSPVQVGDALGYWIDVDKARLGEPLFRLAMFDVGLRTLESKEPLYGLAELLVAPPEAWRTRLLDALVAEIHEHADLAAQVHTRRIEGGRFHGKTLQEAFKATRHEELLAFLGFVSALPGKYVATTWRLADVYATWSINRTPTGDRHAAELQAKPLMNEGDRAAAQGRFKEAEDAYRRALEVLPDDQPLRERFETMRKVRNWSALLEMDPDDTATRWKRMVASFRRSAYATTSKDLELLEKAGYRPEGVLKYRGYVACRQQRFDEALRLFKELLAHGPDEDVARWARSCAQQKELKARPGSARTLLTIAELSEEEESWELAQERYLNALDAAKTKAEREQALRGQRRVILLEDLDTLEQWIKNAIAEHDGQKARKLLTRLLTLCDQVDKPGCAEARLGRVAQAAYESFEEELDIELRRERIRRAPRNVDAHQTLAWSFFARGDLEAATAEVDAAHALDPDRPYTHHIRALLLLEQGRLAEARASAERALVDKSYAWARMGLARISVAEGRHEEAIRWAKEAHALLPDEYDLRRTLTATLRAEEAVRAIREGRDVARNRLRLVRSLVALTLGEAALREAEALRGTPHHVEASWAIASASPKLVRLPQQVKAASAVPAEPPYRARGLAVVHARQALAEHPEDARNRVALARALVADGNCHPALAVLSPLLVDNATQDLSAHDVAELARRGLRAMESMDVATYAHERDDSKSAERFLAQGYEVLEAVGIKSFAFVMANVRASELSYQGRHAEALRFLGPIREAARADGDPRIVQILEETVADLESKTGSLDAVRQVLLQGQAVCEALDDEDCLARTHQQLSEQERVAGRLTAARQELEKALRFAWQVGNKSLVRELLGELSKVSLHMSELKRSRELAEELLLRSREALDAKNEGYARMLLGVVAMRVGDAAGARARFAELYTLGQRTGDTETRAEARYFEGRAALLLSHDPRAAMEAFQQAAELYGVLEMEGSRIRALMGLGEARMELGDHEEARQTLLTARGLARTHKSKVSEGHAQAVLALVELRRGQPEAALEAAGEAVRLAEPAEIIEERWLAYYAMARALEAGGKQAEASAQYEKAVAELVRVLGDASGQAEGADLLSYGRGRQVFQDAIDLYLRLGNTERALALLQLSHDTRLRQLFDATRLGARDAQLQQLGEVEAKTRAARQQLSAEYAKPPEVRSEARVESLSKVIASTQAELRHQLQVIRAQNRPLYSLLTFDPQMLTERRNRPPEGTLVVAYFISSDALYAFLITADQERVQVVKVSVSPRELEEAVFAYHDALVQRGKEASVWAERLHGWLIAPIEAEMARAKTTLVVPFGALYYLPFHALSAPDASGRPVHVLEKHRLGYVSSTTFFKMMEPQRELPVRALLGFANPDGTLVRAREELKRITSESFPEARVLYGQEATSERYFELAGGYDILHFAAHGVLSGNPLASHLKLAGGPLTVDELLRRGNLQGKTGLVVLSACETALEHGNSAGDELISLASAFGAVGAPSIVASLWQVDDEATSELMAHFYAQLRKAPQVDTLEALRQAQLHVLRMTDAKGVRRYQHPSLWAPFMLIGDYR
jgi:CHAT domain-containing protein/Flp pilus assembly protein TadD